MRDVSIFTGGRTRDRLAAARELEVLIGRLRSIIRTDHAPPSGSPSPLRRSETDAQARTGIAHDEA
jgi:hypothetical protein